MSFNNDNNNFEGNFQSTGTHNFRDDYNNMNDRSTGSGFDNDRSFQSNNGTGSFNSGFDRSNERSAESVFNDTNRFTNEQSGRSYETPSSGSFGRDAINSATSDSNRRDNNLKDNAGFSNRGYGNDAPNTEPRKPSKGSAGVMQSSFGAENTTTSTFEQSQGEHFGQGFDGSERKKKDEFGFDGGQDKSRRQHETGAAAGGSGYTAGQDRGFRNDGDNFATDDTSRSSDHSSSHSSGHKQGLGQKLVDKAEGTLHHGHRGETLESRTGVKS